MRQRAGVRATSWTPVRLRDLAAAHAAGGGISVFMLHDRQRGDWRPRSREAAHAVLRAATGDPALCIEKDRFGKPFVPGRPLHVSISHSGPALVIALGAVDLGVDVEILRHPTRWRDLYAWIVAPDERLADPSPRDFLRCWTAKEALVKLLGRGLAEGLDSLSLPADPPRPDGGAGARASSFRRVVAHGRTCWVRHLAPWRETTLALAVACPHFTRTFMIIDYPCLSSLHCIGEAEFYKTQKESLPTAL
ncbi:4'-phosphopantetheinyl transferase family protein [Roseospira visakhapatnamensis]|uniref:Phosphopantetheinyl transferase n=1 Tax=Roseospira visakhapatnamensis TaxID=390880 RepID=A0A7W6RDH4_9PROT|nr:4'-phosphopantetheinyl transferase superfamily protein [Roseospira visakhapatnamensis]MBB4266515.1 phosphopantetheinyl transferase [Roseospira visakhapatnamensis]